MDVAIILIIAVAIGLAIAAIGVAAERASRERAWRDIARERRWNSEHR
jgi:hypothetical protein